MLTRLVKRHWQKNCWSIFRGIQLLFETAQTIIAGIGLLVFVPIEEPDLIPGHQTDLPRLRGLVNELLCDWMGDFGVAAIEVSGTLSNRRDQVLAKIS
ncbi:hypothetical protein [Chitinophaga defluvii]|uniref:Uncharacterized protein n=1 Tax=Chitinophaga defluvii TaxID=3163343 RepID=A0ABV2T0Y7_9BACT